MAICETVTVKRNGVDVVINKSDLDKEPKASKPKAKTVKKAK